MRQERLIRRKGVYKTKRGPGKESEYVSHTLAQEISLTGEGGVNSNKEEKRREGSGKNTGRECVPSE